MLHSHKFIAIFLIQTVLLFSLEAKEVNENSHSSLKTALNLLSKIANNKAVQKLEKKLKAKSIEKLKEHGTTIDLPDLQLPFLEKHFELQNMALSINESLYEKKPWKNLPDDLKVVDQSQALHIYLTGESIIKIGNYTHKGSILINLNQDISSKSITLFSFEENDNLFGALNFADIKFFKKTKLSGKTVFEVTLSLDENDEPKDIQLAALENLSINDKYIELAAIFEISQKEIGLEYIEIKDDLTLDSFISMPGAKGFAFYDLKIYLPVEGSNEFGIKTKTKFFGIENDLYIFEYDDNVALAVDISTKGEEKFNLSKLIEKASLGSLASNTIEKFKGFGVAKGMVILSDKQFKLTKSTLKKGIAKDFIVETLGKSKNSMDVYNLSFVGDYDIDLAGDLGKVLSSGIQGFNFGLSSDAKLEGHVEGIFDKNPFSFKLEFQEEDGSSFGLSKLSFPKGFHPKEASTSVSEGLFLTIVEGEVELGVDIDFSLSVNNKEIDLDGAIGVVTEDENVGVSLTGKINDTIDNFLGIEHFQVNGGTVTTSIEVDTIVTGLELDTSFLGRVMSMTGDLVYDEKGYPKGVGTKIYISKLDKDGWKLVNYSTIIGLPTFAAAGIGSVAGAGVFGVVGGLVGNVIGDVAGGVAGAPFAGAGAAPGAVIGGVASTAIVGIASTAVGAVGMGVVEGIQGFALGAIGDAIIGNTKLGKEGMDKMTDLEAYILKADETYLSAATENASNADLELPSGIHLNIDNVTLFNKYNKDFKPNFTWIYSLGNKLSKDVIKGENLLKNMEKDFEKSIKKFEKKLKEKEEELKKEGKKLVSNWKQQAKKDIMKDFKFADDEIKKAEKYVKKFVTIFNQVMSVIHYELGLSSKKPTIKYHLTKTEKEGLEKLKDILNGIKMKNEKFGPLNIKDISIDLVPSFQAVGKAKVFDADEMDVTVEFEDNSRFPSFYADITTDIFGDLHTKFILKNDNSVDLEGEFSSADSFEKWLEKQVTNDIDKILDLNTNIYKKLNNKLSSLTTKVKDKEADYSRLISKAGEEAYIDAKDAVKDAKKEWNKVKGDFDSYVQKCKDYKICHKKYLLGGKEECNYPCKSFLNGAGHDINYVINKIHWFIGGSKPKNPKAYEDKFHAAYNNAEQKYYEPFKTKVKSELDTLKSDLSDVKNTLDTIGNFTALKSKINTFEKNTIEVKEILIAGEYKTNNKKDLMFLLELKYSFKEKQKKDYFLFKPFDMKFNENSFALIATMILDDFLKEEKALPAPATWLLSNVDKILKENKAFLMKNIDKNDEEKYKKILSTFEKNTQSFQKANKNFEAKRMSYYDNLSKVDLMSESKVFNDRYIAIGHSSLCLSVAPNGVDVYQTNCKDNESERWSTNSIGKGYVQLKSKGLCLKAKTKENKNNGQALGLSACNTNDEHEKWKVISKDGLYDMIVNKYSEKCLHFNTPNANPKTAYAVWTSCMNVDSQLFRDIKDAQKPSWNKVEKKIEAKNGSCLTISPKLLKSFEHYKANRFLHETKKIDFEKIEKEKQNILIAKKCTDKSIDRFNYLEEINGDIKLVDTTLGWCVAPKDKHSSELILIPCNRSDKVFWKNKQEGDSFELINSNNRCMTLEAIGKNRNSAKAHLIPCMNKDSQEIEFVK